MQLDRLMMKTVTRIARSGITGLRPATRHASDKADKPELRGSGSWANEWNGAKNVVERAKSLARPGRARRKDEAETRLPDDAIPEGTIHVRALMSGRDVKLHNWIADHMEAEAPTCTLHVGVALSAFLTSDVSQDDSDPLSGLIADMLIVDEHGQAVAALIRESASDPSRQLLVLEALLDAGLPIVDIPARPSLSGLWTAISETLPKE